MWSLYAFLPGNRDVRCFEISTRTNKTFNLSRAEEVELVDLRWSYREEHRPLLGRFVSLLWRMYHKGGVASWGAGKECAAR